MAKTNIVIVGGGLLGVSTARGLSRALDPQLYSIQLVTSRDYYVHLLAALRIITTDEGRLEDQALLPYDRVFEPGKAGEIVVGTVERFDGGNVAVLTDGRSLPFDYLVLGSGSIWSGPLNLPSTRKETQVWIESWRSKIAQAKKVVLVGGGAVGYELAGEIRHFHPGTSVTIVHSDAKLFNATYPDRFRDKARKAAEGKGIQILTGQKVVNIPETTGQTVTVETTAGKTLEADLVIPTWGASLNTDFIKSLDPSIVTAERAVKVEPTLQVKGHPNVFAGGDIIEWNEQKQLAKIAAHVDVLVPNLLKTITNDPKASYKNYATIMEGIIAPLGPKAGVGYLPVLGGWVVGDWISTTLKSKGLFIDKSRAALGYAK